MGFTRRTLLAVAVSAGAALPASAQPAPARPAPAVRVEAADFGVAADAARDNGPALQQALDAAGYRQRRAPGRWAEVRLPCHAPFASSGEAIGWQGTVAIPDSVALVGCGGARVTTATDDRGTAYRPVREVADLPDAATTGESRLRLLDDALLRGGTGGVAPTYVAHRFEAAAGVRALALRDLVLDGNWRGNAAAMAAQSDAWRETNLRNSPGWTGLNVSNHDGAARCDAAGRPAHVEVTRVAVVGFGATALLGNANEGPLAPFGRRSCTAWRLREVLAADALYNHVLYGVNGTAADGGGWTDVTVAGFGWTQVITTNDLDADNVVFERWTPSPSGRDYDGHLWNVRAGRVTVRGLYVDTRDSAAAARAAAGDVQAKDRVTHVVRIDAGTSEWSRVTWRTGLAGYVFGGGGQGTTWTGVVVAPERGLLGVADPHPWAAEGGTVLRVALADWRVEQGPAARFGYSRAFTPRETPAFDLTVERSVLQGFDALVEGNPAVRVAVSDSDVRTPVVSLDGGRTFASENVCAARSRTGRLSGAPSAACRALLAAPR